MPLGAFKAALMGTAGATTEGDVVLLSSQTASSASEIEFTSGIDSTYGEYIFRFYNISAGTNTALFHFQVGSGYNTTVTSTYFDADHRQDGSGPSLQYVADKDQAQGTAYQVLTAENDSTASSSASGELVIFNPASTTYVKHWYSTFNTRTLLGGSAHQLTYNSFAAGYFNTTSAITQAKFKMEAGTFDGTIKMWGVK